jgi:hypothetical protein
MQYLLLKSSTENKKSTVPKMTAFSQEKNRNKK